MCGKSKLVRFLVRPTNYASGSKTQLALLKGMSLWCAMKMVHTCSNQRLQLNSLASFCGATLLLYKSIVMRIKGSCKGGVEGTTNSPLEGMNHARTNKSHV